jgi:hypothetical protein
MKNWAIVAMLFGGLLLTSTAFASEDVDVVVDCPASGTAARGSTITVSAHVKNSSGGPTFHMTKYALILNLGGLNITGPSSHPLAFTVNPASTVTENISVPIPSRASVGTVAQIGLLFSGTSSTDGFVAVKPHGMGGCVVEIIP